jgi:hypothetical protein
MERMNRRDDSVKRPSSSIAEMMAIVAIVALDCLVISVGRSPQSGPYLILGGFPLQCALVIGLFLIIRRRLDKPLPFLLGFEVVGWTSHLIYVAVCVLAANSIDNYRDNSLDILNSLLGTNARITSVVGVITICGIFTFCLTAPQVAIALVAGWISQRWWKQRHPEKVAINE